MAKYIQKPPMVEAITFEELVAIGKETPGVNVVNGMPWSFEFHHHAITHENDECYLIPTAFGIRKFTLNDMLVIETDESLLVIKKEVFFKNYEMITDLYNLV